MELSITVSIMDGNKLCVIVPVFNTAQYVIRCLESLVNQSLKDIEIIVVNDGSTDNSNELILDYILHHSNIKYLSLDKNYGLGHARNIGIEKSTSKYITFVDSDDWVDLDLYEIMCNSLEYDNTDIAICGIKNEYSNSCMSEIRYSYSYSNIVDGNMLLSLLTKSESNNYYISPVVWNKVYKRSLFVDYNLNFLNNSFWEDDIFSFLAFSVVKKASIVPQIYYHYYMRQNSITNSISKKHIDDFINSFKYLKERISTDINLDFEEKYNALFDRCASSLVKMIINNEQSVFIQKKYLSYFFTQFSSCFSVEKAINYLDINRIERLFK